MTNDKQPDFLRKLAKAAEDAIRQNTPEQQLYGLVRRVASDIGVDVTTLAKSFGIQIPGLDLDPDEPVPDSPYDDPRAPFATVDPVDYAQREHDRIVAQADEMLQRVKAAAARADDAGEVSENTPSMRTGVWRHWKGERYLAFGIAHDADIESIAGRGIARNVVVYVPLYWHEDLAGPRMAVRTYEDFLAKVCLKAKLSEGACNARNAAKQNTKHEHDLVPRFTYEG